MLFGDDGKSSYDRFDRKIRGRETKEDLEMECLSAETALLNAQRKKIESGEPEHKVSADVHVHNDDSKGGGGLCCLLAGLALVGMCAEGKSQEIWVPSSKEEAIRMIERYQKEMSPELQKKYGQLCRYTPSCSEYAKQAIQVHGSSKGILLATYRIMRCNPLSHGGNDPIT